MQNYANHMRLVTGFHKILFPVLVLTLIGACVNFATSLGDHERMYSASLILVFTACVIAVTLFTRVFSLKAQDRAIRAEENLRHFAMTGRLLDPRLSVKQIVALRFASDGEFVALAARAAEQKLAPTAIKQAIKNWRTDENRV
jgi:uncharacterized membrane protein